MTFKGIKSDLYQIIITPFECSMRCYVLLCKLCQVWEWAIGSMFMTVQKEMAL